MHVEGTLRTVVTWRNNWQNLDFTVNLTNDEMDEVRRMMGDRVIIDIQPKREHRSLNANAYFWHLCGEIAKKLGSHKDVIYLQQLESYGVFQDVEVTEEASNVILDMFRHVEEQYRYEVIAPGIDGDDHEVEMICLRCYIGSSHYDTKQMSDLINGTVSDAKDLGIDTWTPDEIAEALSQWKARN